MPYFRKVKGSKWDKESNGETYQPLTLPSDPVGDLGTTQGVLSLWYVNEDLSNLNDVILGVLANNNTFSHLDYALLPDVDLSRLPILVTSTAGRTTYDPARAYHRNLEVQTAAKLVDLACTIINVAQFERIPKDDCIDRLVQAIREKRIDPSQLNPELRPRLEQLLSSGPS
jgi:hypothetical protein